MSTVELHTIYQPIADFIVVEFLTFEKTDGSIRKMWCTLCPTFIPKSVTKKIKDPDKKYSEENIRVWDLEKESWRSFKIANVIEVV